MTAESRYDPEGARYEALDNGGFSADVIDARLGKRAVTAATTPPYPQSHERPPHPRSAVRGFGDGELRDSENPAFVRGTELTPDEQLRSAAALSEVREGLKGVKEAELMRKAALLIPDDPNDAARVAEARARYIRATQQR